MNLCGHLSEPMRSFIIVGELLTHYLYLEICAQDKLDHDVLECLLCSPTSVVVGILSSFMFFFMNFPDFDFHCFQTQR